MRKIMLATYVLICLISVIDTVTKGCSAERLLLAMMSADLFFITLKNKDGIENESI